MIITGGIILFLYALISAGVYLYQDKLVFHPEKLPIDYKFEFRHDFEEINLQTKDNVTINALWFKQPNKSKGVILYFHGNAGSLVNWGDVSNDLMRYGYDIFMIDYRTYGKSTGTPSESHLYADAMMAYKYVRKFYSNNEVIVYGRSLGTGIALNLCKKVKPRQLILETPYLSMRAMADKTIPWLPVSLILKYPIRSDRFIKRVKCPIDMIHGTEDELIPYEQAVKLAKLNKRTRLHIIVGGKHSDLNQFDEFQPILNNIITTHEPS